MKQHKCSIPFVQYLRPYHNKRDVSIERPEDIYDKARDIIAAGNQFEAEVLGTGQVHLTVSGPDKNGYMDDLDHEIVENGPEVPKAVDRMVTRFWDANLSQGGEADDGDEV